MKDKHPTIDEFLKNSMEAKPKLLNKFYTDDEYADYLEKLGGHPAVNSFSYPKLTINENYENLDYAEANLVSSILKNVPDSYKHAYSSELTYVLKCGYQYQGTLDQGACIVLRHFEAARYCFLTVETVPKYVDIQFNYNTLPQQVVESYTYKCTRVILTDEVVKETYPQLSETMKSGKWQHIGYLTDESITFETETPEPVKLSDADRKYGPFIKKLKVRGQDVCKITYYDGLHRYEAVVAHDTNVEEILVKLTDCPPRFKVAIESGKAVLVRNRGDIIDGQHLAAIAPLQKVVKCPDKGCQRSNSIQYIIIHLNDGHEWSREAIADWLDTLDEQPVFHPKEPSGFHEVARMVEIKPLGKETQD